MRSHISLIAAFVAVLGLGWSAPARACDGTQKGKTAATKAPKGAAQVALALEGLTCGDCAAKVRTALTNIDGVYTAEVNLAQKTALVKYARGKVTVDNLVKAIEEAGYKAKVQKV